MARQIRHVVLCASCHTSIYGGPRSAGSGTMDKLPDVLAPRLKIVFCGTAEAWQIESVLRDTGRQIKATAYQLGISRMTLWRRSGRPSQEAPAFRQGTGGRERDDN